MLKPLQGNVRCLLVRPEFLDQTFYNPREMFRMLGADSAAPPLGLLLTAANLPGSWRLRFVDGDVEPITDAHLEWADVIFISCKGPQQVPTRELVQRAHAHGIPAVVGGAGPTLQWRDYEGYADYIVAGESEPVLPQLLADLAEGRSAGLYRASESADLTGGRIPRWDLADLSRYLFVGMSYARGCPFACEFCAQIEIFGRKPRTQSVAHILAQHQRLYDLGYRGMVDLGYDNLIGDLDKAEELLGAMLEWNREHRHPFFYSTEATMNLARQPRLLELMRDNDFRYVFMGIESGDEDALKATKKGQNTAMNPAEATKALNAHGMVVNTGLILGFDGEKDDAADKMLDMVRRTAAFPTLVLPLHALPSTQLAKRLAREGRLFDGGVQLRNEQRTDTATTGLNFVTKRPRVEIIEDLVRVLTELYEPSNHYDRIELLLQQLRIERKFTPPARQLVPLAKSFLRIALMMSRDEQTRRRFWPGFLKCLVQNPGILEVFLGQAVMNDNYARQSRLYVEALRQEIRQVEEVGEAQFNALMTDRAPDVPEAALRSTS